MEILRWIFWKYFEMTLRMTVIIIPIFILSNIYMKKYSAKFRYYMWIPIIIGLMIPINLNLDNAIVKLPVVLEKQLPKQNMKLPNIVKSKDVNKIKNNPAEIIYQYDGIRKRIINNGKWKVVEYMNNIDFKLLIIVWVLVAVLYVLYHIFKYLLFLKKLIRWSTDINNNSIIYIFNQIKKDMKIQSYIDLKRCRIISSPMIIGFLKPTLLLSQKDYTSEELSFIFKHELTHYKRRDGLYKLILVIANAIHWYNPFVHIMCMYIATECEVSCDEQVVYNQQQHVKENYGRFMIDEISYAKNKKTILGHYFYGGKKEMKRRLKVIIDTQKKKKGIITAIIISTMLLVLSSFTVLSDDIKEIKETHTLVSEEKEASVTCGVESKEKKCIEFNISSDLITVAMQYASYNEKTKISEKLFSEPRKMTNSKSIDVVVNKFKGLKFQNMSKAELESILDGSEKTYHITFYSKKENVGEIIFYDLDKIIFLFEDEYYISTLESTRREELIFELITFFKPVNF